MRKILDISKENSVYMFETGAVMNKGFMAFIRKISNKLVETQKKSVEVANFLDSLPEWTEYFNEDLTKINSLESRPLCNDPRNKGAQSNDDDLEFFFKLKNFDPKQKTNET
jgi:hypothetical protein